MAKSRRIWDDSEKNRIEGIVARLHNAKDAYAIMKWLDNFDDSDRSLALAVLENLQYRSAEDIYAIIKKQLAYLGIHHKLCKVYLVPIGKLGKSGSLIAYYINRAIKDKDKFIIVSQQEMGKQQFLKNIQEKDVLCLMDDFVGSGDTIKKDVKKHQKIYNQFAIKYAFLLGYMPKGKIVMDSLGFKVLGEPYESAFKRRNSVWGNETRMKSVREMVYKYGKVLSPKSKRTKAHPLGYSNMQALVAFDYSSPNDSLPILWADGRYRDRKWFPLFPRFSVDFVNQLSIVRRNYWLWLSENKKLESPFAFIKDGEPYTILKVQLFMLAEMIYAHRSRSLWGQSMGITSVELEDLLKTAIGYGMIDERLQLQDKALKLLREVHKAQKIISGDEQEVEMQNLANTYVPKRFMGGS